MWAEIRAGRNINKEDRYRAMAAALGRRNPKAVSRKCANISAVLRDFGSEVWCPGLKPDDHYQKLLAKAVLEWVDGEAAWLDLLSPAATIQPGTLGVPVIGTEEVEPPRARDPLVQAWGALAPGRSFRIIDFVAQAERNRQLGEQGEAFVLDREQRRLTDVARRPDLARKVQWTSKTVGDGAGYDIAWFDGDGRPRLIEVKTTTLGMRAPFFVSRRELQVSEDKATQYQLCRVFDFTRSPRFFRLRGALSANCRLSPQSYVARVGRGIDTSP